MYKRQKKYTDRPICLSDAASLLDASDFFLYHGCSRPAAVIKKDEADAQIIKKRAEDLLGKMQEKDGIALQDFLEHYQLELHLEENESSSLQFYVKDGEEERPLRCDIRRLKNEKGQHLGQLFVFSDAALETDLLTGFQEWESFQRFVKERKDSFPPSTGIVMCVPMVLLITDSPLISHMTIPVEGGKESFCLLYTSRCV